MNAILADYRRKSVVFFICAVLLFGVLSGGCVPLIVGGAGIVAGYSLSNDSAMGNVKCDYRVAWDAALKKLEAMEAEIRDVDESKGLMKCFLYDSNVTVSISSIYAKTQKLKVSARKGIFPKPQLAQKVFMEIVDDIK